MSGQRQAALILGALALIPGIAIAGQATLATSTLDLQEFKPPLRPMILTRELHLPLANGKEIVSLRRYTIQMVADGAGWRIAGHFLDVQVSAPPVLAALVDMERHRSDDGLFPMRLAHNGLIEAAALPVDRQAVHQAATQSVTRIASSGLPSAERQVATGFVRKIEANNQAGVTAWPTDLFHPAQPQHSESRAMALPGGETGTITVATQSRADRGLMQSYERVVTTEIGGSQRVTREVWTLAAE